MILDSLGERYGCLPSDVLARADTLDLWVFDVAISYKNYKAEQQAAKRHGTTTHKLTENFDPEILQQKLEAFNEQNKNR